MNEPVISIVVAIGTGGLHNNALGKGNELLWHIPDDLKRFKALTLGHPVIMGRKTFESIVTVLGKPLPGRTNIVITRDTSYQGLSSDVKTGDKSSTDSTFVIAHSIEDAIAKAREIDKEEIFIGGGGQIYTQALQYVDRLYLTLIDDDKEGDSYFPKYEADFTKKVSEEKRDWNGISYIWLTLERK